MSNNNEATSSWRHYAALGVFIIAAVLLAGRAAQLQLTEREFLKNHGDARYLRTVEIPAHRGMILDRRGEPLAVSVNVNSVWAHPGRLLRAREQWPRLADILEMTPEHLRTIIEPRAQREFVYLRRHIDPTMAQAVQDAALPGVNLMREPRRFYPAAETAAHLVGFTNVDDFGQEGLELAFDASLRGEAGAKRVIKDRLGRVVENVERVSSARAGATVSLSIDKRVQYVAYRELKRAVQQHNAVAGSAVVIDARSGEVLAMVNQPSFNPNNRSGLKSDYYRNRAVTDLFEPGSTIKPFTIAAAIDSGIVTAQTEIDTSPGRFKVGQHTVRDMHNYGRLDVAGIIEKSSNVGASKIALGMDPEVLWSAFSRLGFGVTTDLGFPGESAGRLNDYRHWREIEHATMAFGYGLSLSVTQLAQAYTVLANDGQWIPLSLLKRTTRPAGTRVFSPDTARVVRDMLEAVVETGTGNRAAISGYRVAGKTGTVHKATAEGYAEDRYVSVFAGMLPASNPRLVAVVMIDEPRNGEYFGGTVAAPVFSAAMRDIARILNVAPDALSEYSGARMAARETLGSAQ